MLDLMGTRTAMQLLTQQGSSYVNEHLLGFPYKSSLVQSSSTCALLESSKQGWQRSVCHAIGEVRKLTSAVPGGEAPLQLGAQLSTVVSHCPFVLSCASCASAWAGKMLHTCTLDEGCSCVSGHVRKHRGSSLDVLAKTHPAQCQEHTNK